MSALEANTSDAGLSSHSRIFSQHPVTKIYNYPRTRHIECSRLQVGDIADDNPIKELMGQPLIVEEKLDGANSAVSFDENGNLLPQSRGHFCWAVAVSAILPSSEPGQQHMHITSTLRLATAISGMANGCMPSV